jgi:elongation factor P
MYTLKDLKSGLVIQIDGEPYIVLKAEFSKQGRQGGVSATKLKNLVTGSAIQKTFQGSDKIEPADVGYRHVQYLYGDESSHTFMDLTDYNQFELSTDVVGEASDYLVDGMELDVQVFKEKPIGIKLASTVILEVVETPPGVKGDTATGGTKPATLNSGLVVQVPLFIKEGEKIKVNTERKEYVERA